MAIVWCVTSSLHVWCPISWAMSSGVLSCLFRCVGSAPARSNSFIASALSCRAQRCNAVSPSIVVLSIPPVDMFCTRKSIICKLFPISRRIAKCKAVSPRSYRKTTYNISSDKLSFLELLTSIETSCFYERFLNDRFIHFNAIVLSYSRFDKFLIRAHFFI